MICLSVLTVAISSRHMWMWGCLVMVTPVIYLLRSAGPLAVSSSQCCERLHVGLVVKYRSEDRTISKSGLCIGTRLGSRSRLTSPPAIETHYKAAAEFRQDIASHPATVSY